MWFGMADKLCIIPSNWVTCPTLLICTYSTFIFNPHGLPVSTYSLLCKWNIVNDILSYLWFCYIQVKFKFLLPLAQAEAGNYAN